MLNNSSKKQEQNDNELSNSMMAGRDINIQYIKSAPEHQEIVIPNKFQKTDEFINFLNSTELLNSFNIEKDFLDLWIDIGLLDDQQRTTVDMDDILKILRTNKNILITGDSESSKTSCLKYIMHRVAEDSFLVYIDLSNTIGVGKVINKINDSLKKNYENKPRLIDLKDEKVYIFIDNFDRMDEHNNSHEKLIQQLDNLELDYSNIYCIMTCNKQVQELSFKFQTDTISFLSYSIKPIGLQHRDQIICRWLSYKQVSSDNYEVLRESYNQRLKDLIFRSIVPNTVFFTYTLLYMLDSHNSPHTTTYKHCYENIINSSMRKAGISVNNIPGYIGFLSTISYKMYQKDQKNISKEEIDLLIESYAYDVPDKYDIMIKKLILSDIIIEVLGKYEYKHEYIYYYLLALYFTNNFEDNRDNIFGMIDNLQSRINAYTITFLTYHRSGDNRDLLDRLTQSLDEMYAAYPLFSLNHSEVLDIDDLITKDPVFSLKFTKISNNPEKNKSQYLATQDKMDTDQVDQEDTIDIKSGSEETNKMLKFLRTIEVIGNILKNNPHTIKKEIKDLYLQKSIECVQRFIGMMLYTKTESPDDPSKNYNGDLYSYIFNKLSKYFETHPDDLNKLAYEKNDLINKIYTELILMIYGGSVNIIVQNLCSLELMTTLDRYIEENKFPLIELAHFKAMTTYTKVIYDESINHLLNHKESSVILDRLVEYSVYEYCWLNKISNREKRKLEDIFKKNYKFKYGKNRQLSFPISIN